MNEKEVEESKLLDDFLKELVQQVQNIIDANPKYAPLYFPARVLRMDAEERLIYGSIEGFQRGSHVYLPQFKVRFKLKKWVSVSQRITSYYLKEVMPELMKNKYAFRPESLEVEGSFDQSSLSGVFTFNIYSEEPLVKTLSIRMSKELFDEG